MPSLPVLIAITLGVCGVVAVAFWLRRSRRDRPAGDAAGTRPTAPVQRMQLLTTGELSDRLGLPVERLQAHVSQYREVLIPKPGGRQRRLEVPDEATKQLQRTILKRLLAAANSHPMACGFEEGASIVDAALPHEGKQVVVKMDIRQFFESTSAQRVQAWFASIGWDDEAAVLLTRLTTCNGHLPQGAPTSPRLTNLVNARLDQALLLVARQHGGHYSRYADDITMSFSNRRGRKIRGIVQVVRRILRSFGYTMHGGRKLKILRQHQPQKVLGLIVNQRVALPRKTRRWIRAVRHNLDLGKPITLTEQQLLGWEALARMVQSQRDED
ncbi:MAG: reverse transcriptase family protein [Planctomycetaceae bacterium]|nr:reverse transcriptase family protein [Planctomycetaceae bacterium]